MLWSQISSVLTFSFKSFLGRFNSFPRARQIQENSVGYVFQSEAVVANVSMVHCRVLGKSVVLELLSSLFGALQMKLESVEMAGGIDSSNKSVG